MDAYWTCADQSQQPVPASGQVAGYTSYRLLFNVTADPEEKHNLVEAMPDEAANLQAILDAASAEAVPPQNATKDPLADTACLASNLTFVPWLEQEMRTKKAKNRTHSK